MILRFFLRNLIKKSVSNPRNIAMMSIGLASAASSLRFRDLWFLLQTLRTGGLEKVLTSPIFLMLPKAVAWSGRSLRTFLLLSLVSKVSRVLIRAILIYPLRLVLGNWVSVWLGLPLDVLLPSSLFDWNVRVLSSIQNFVSDTLIAVGGLSGRAWFSWIGIITFGLWSGYRFCPDTWTLWTYLFHPFMAHVTSFVTVTSLYLGGTAVSVINCVFSNTLAYVAWGFDQIGQIIGYNPFALPFLTGTLFPFLAICKGWVVSSTVYLGRWILVLIFRS